MWTLLPDARACCQFELKVEGVMLAEPGMALLCRSASLHTLTHSLTRFKYGCLCTQGNGCGEVDDSEKSVAAVAGH